MDPSDYDLLGLHWCDVVFLILVYRLEQNIAHKFSVSKRCCMFCHDSFDAINYVNDFVGFSTWCRAFDHLLMFLRCLLMKES